MSSSVRGNLNIRRNIMFNKNDSSIEFSRNNNEFEFKIGHEQVLCVGAGGITCAGFPEPPYGVTILNEFVDTTITDVNIQGGQSTPLNVNIASGGAEPPYGVTILNESIDTTITDINMQGGQTTALNVNISGGAEATCGTDLYVESTTKCNVIGVVRSDTLAPKVGTDNEVSPLQCDGDGSLYVTVSNFTDIPSSATNLNQINSIGPIDTGSGTGGTATQRVIIDSSQSLGGDGIIKDVDFTAIGSQTHRLGSHLLSEHTAGDATSTNNKGIGIMVERDGDFVYAKQHDSNFGLLTSNIITDVQIDVAQTDLLGVINTNCEHADGDMAAANNCGLGVLTVRSDGRYKFLHSELDGSILTSTTTNIEHIDGDMITASSKGVPSMGLQANGAFKHYEYLNGCIGTNLKLIEGSAPLSGNGSGSSLRISIADDQSDVPIKNGSSGAISTTIDDFLTQGSLYQGGDKGVACLGLDSSNNYRTLLTDATGVLMSSNTANGFVDAANSSTALLADSAIFSGAWTEVVEYSEFACTVTTSHNGMLSLKISTDGVNTERTKMIPITPNGGVFTLAIVSRYMKVEFQNTSGATQTTFRLQSLFHKYKSKNLTSTTSETISDQNDVELVRVVNDTMLDLSRGIYSDKYTIHKFGRNPNQSTVWEDVWAGGSAMNRLPTAVNLEVVSTSANDTVAGSGARSITIEGLDVNGNAISEDLNMNGTSSSSGTSNVFKRLNRAYVKECGTEFASNFGDISINEFGTSNVVSNILGLETHNTANYGIGQTQRGIFSIPAGYTGYITRIDVFVSDKTATVILYKQSDILNSSAPFAPRRMVWVVDDAKDEYSAVFDSYLKIPELTDLWFRAKGNAADTVLEVTFDMILIKNPLV